MTRDHRRTGRMIRRLRRIRREHGPLAGVYVVLTFRAEAFTRALVQAALAFDSLSGETRPTRSLIHNGRKPR